MILIGAIGGIGIERDEAQEEEDRCFHGYSNSTNKKSEQDLALTSSALTFQIALARFKVQV